MDSLWDDREAAQAASELARCAYTARLLGKEKSLVLSGSGSVSVKVTEKDLFGQGQQILYVSDRDADLATIGADGFSPIRLEDLGRLTTLDTLPDELLVNELAARRTDGSAPAPPLEALLHAVLPDKYVAHVYADALLAITNTPSPINHLREIYGDTVILVPYARPGFALAKLVAEAFAHEGSEDTGGIVLVQQGLISCGKTARIAYERLLHLVSRAEEYLRERDAWHVAIPDITTTDTPKQITSELAGLRQTLAAIVGFPLVITTYDDPQCLGFARRGDLVAIAQRGPATPKHAVLIKRSPLLGRDVAAYVTAYQAYWTAHAAGDSPAREDLAPRVILDPELGMCTVGRSAGEAALVGDVYRHTMEIIQRAEALEAYRPASAREVFDVEYLAWKQSRPDVRQVFAGEVALVTGAASGIGKACIESFLARGAAAVGLDINPCIVEMFDRIDYLGLQCDVTNDDEVRAALEATVRTFGGLDMLVLNAGVFPAGCRIESLHLEECDRVMRVNLDANITLMREAHPLLKTAPDGGRVVINGSRNVLAPGPGATAYSISKAALTQLARVAALEWGQDNIRVNVIHAHAVFDTGIWTEEVLCARAEHYGMTVEEYKKNNVLQVEVTSRDVGELVAEMCGPLFAKTTGAQIPIDGGSNRVI